jgi:hypothetical protein
MVGDNGRELWDVLKMESEQVEQIEISVSDAIRYPSMAYHISEQNCR